MIDVHRRDAAELERVILQCQHTRCVAKTLRSEVDEARRWRWAREEDDVGSCRVRHRRDARQS